ncbi:MAG TPA: DUF4037 domain-containing protein [Streptosporangiaceae bacterium]|jgi:hypothetical protein
MTAFRPGLELSAAYYAEVVAPLLAAECPGLAHAAARLGQGSEVQGFDTERSTDHDWGPRLLIALDGRDAARAAEVTAMLAGRLPARFRGYRTAYPLTTEPGSGVRHRVEVAGLGEWLAGWLGFDPRDGVGLLDWLATPAQRLAEITAGRVFHDGLAAADGSGGLGAARAALAWYPRDVWCYILACQWQRVAQEESFPGRCAEAGDELGSAVVTARLARDLMRLALLMHRRYPLYSKWLGTAFARTPGAASLGAPLAAAVAAGSWPDRQRALSRACEAAARMHNELGLTEPLDPAVRDFYDRPYQVLDAGRFVTVLRDQVADPQVRGLPLTGTADQFTDSTDALGDIGRLRGVCAASYGISG